jgi:pyruvate/2-oxoglutarate dehydrogenase complex dihydrolipoamide acyltransferase (E2) component
MTGLSEFERRRWAAVARQDRAAARAAPAAPPPDREPTAPAAKGWWPLAGVLFASMPALRLARELNLRASNFEGQPAGGRWGGYTVRDVRRIWREVTGDPA